MSSPSPKLEDIFHSLSDNLNNLKIALNQVSDPAERDKWCAQYQSVTQQLNGIVDSSKSSPEFRSDVSDTLTFNLPNGTIGILDEDLKIEYIGGKGLQLHDLDPKQLLGQVLPDMNNSSRDREMLRRVFSETLKGKENTVEVSHRDNFYKVRTQPLKLPECDKPRMMFLSQNITAEKKEQLKLYAALETSGVIVVEYDYSERRFAPNPAFNKLLGYEADKILTMDLFLSRFSEEGKRIRQQSLKRAAKTGKLEYETRIYTPEGLKYIRVCGHIQVNDEGVYELGVGAVLDITEHLGQLEKLRLSRKHFQQIADSTPAMIWMSDATQAITYLNPSWLEFTGGSLEEDLGEGWLRHLHPDDTDKFRQFQKTSFATKEEFTSEFRVRRHDGVYCWTLNRGVPLYSPEGEFQGFIGSSLDISSQKEFTNRLEYEVKERTRELAESNEQLLKLNLHLEEYAYAASHDLQEPLRKIELFLSIIRDNRDNPEKIDRYLRKGEKAASRMRMLIKDILLYNGIGKYSSEMEEVKMMELLQEIREDFQMILDESGTQLEIEDLGSIRGYKTKLYQLLTNLIKNGITYNENIPYLRIRRLNEAELSDSKNLLPFKSGVQYQCFEVADNGIGFDMEKKDQILKPFRRLHSSSQYPGSGLGLSICEKIVTLHQGFMDIQSVPGKGSKFRIYLPDTQETA